MFLNMKLNEFYKFHQSPFKRNIGSLYESKDYKEIYQRLMYFVEEEGIALITGASGIGKTMITRSIVNQTNEKVIYIPNNELTLFEFYNCLGRMMEVPTNHCHMSQILMDISHRIDAYDSIGKKVLLIIDDAETLEYKIIMDLKHLYESNNIKRTGMKIILLGHSSFRGKIKRANNTALLNNITTNYECVGLTMNETKEYIQHRLKRAGGDVAMIDDRYYNTIYSYTDGKPQIINKYMSTVLLVQYIKKATKIDNKILKLAQQEMEI